MKKWLPRRNRKEQIFKNIDQTVLEILYKSYLQGIDQLILLLYLAELRDGSSLHRSLVLVVLCKTVLELLEFVG